MQQAIIVEGISGQANIRTILSALGNFVRRRATRDKMDELICPLSKVADEMHCFASGVRIVSVIKSVNGISIAGI